MRFDHAKTSVALAAFMMLAPGMVSPGWSLCGDLSGDGYVRASDALATLVLALSGDYQARADVTAGRAPPDGRVTATDALAVLIAAVAGSVPSCAATEHRAVVTLAACDFITGGIAEIDLSSRSVVRRHIGQVAADAVVRRTGGRLFVLNRFGGDSVAEIDPTTLSTMWECGIGSGSNPHDIVLTSPTHGYVTRYDWTDLAVIDPSKGSTGCSGFVEGAIDLSSLADSDGFPEMDQMALVGNRLFVSVQRLDRNDFFRPGDRGALAVVDTDTDTVEATIELTLVDPFAETKGLLYDASRNRLYVGGPGLLFTDLADGGIEIIDPTRLVSFGMLATGADLGGDLTDFVMAGSGRILATVADASFAASVVDFDVTTRAITRVLVKSPFLLSDIELTENGELWVSDRNCSGPGLRAFAIADGSELTPEPLYPGLTPFNVLLGR